MESVTTQEVNRYSRLKLKISKIHEDIKFLKKCKSHRIFPNFIKIRASNVEPKRVKEIINKAKMAWLKSEIQNHYRKINNFSLNLYNLNLKIIKNMSASQSIWWSEKCRKIDNSNRQTLRSKIKTLNNKLKNLKEDKSINVISDENNIEEEPPTPQNLNNYVINLSSHQFTDLELNVLHKGLKYKPTPKIAPLKEIVVNIEAQISQQNISYLNKLKIREECTQILTTTSNIQHKYNRDEMITIKISVKKKCTTQSQINRMGL